MANERLSNQDLMDLEEIRKRLPAGDPRLAKIDALKQASNASPTEFERERGVGENGEQPGILESAWNTVKKMPEGMMRSMATGASMADPMTQINDRSGTQSLPEQAIESSRAGAEKRQVEGRSPVYQAIAPVGEMAGVDVQGMEDAADHANPRGVIGAGIGSAAPYVLPAAVRSMPKVLPEALREPIGNTGRGVAYKTVNSILRTRPADFEFSGNPGRGVVDEGIVAPTRNSLAKKIDAASGKRTSQLDEVLSSPEASSKRVNAARPIRTSFDPKINEAEWSDPALAGRLGEVRDSMLTRPLPRAISNANIESLTPLEATNVKRAIGRNTKFTGNAFDNQVNAARAGSYAGIDSVVDEAVPESKPINSRLHDLIGASKRIEYQNRLKEGHQPVNLTDIATAAAGEMAGGSGIKAAVLRRMIGSTPVNTGIAYGANKFADWIHPEGAPPDLDALPPARRSGPRPIRGLLGPGPIRLGSQMEPIDASTTSTGPIDWGTRATRTGRLLPEHASMPRPIQMGSQMEPIEDVGPMSQPAASEEQVNPGGPGAYRRNMFTTSSKQPRGIRLPESPFGFGPEDEESEIEQARRR